MIEECIDKEIAGAGSRMVETGADAALLGMPSAAAGHA